MQRCAHSFALTRPLETRRLFLPIHNWMTPLGTVSPLP